MNSILIVHNALNILSVLLRIASYLRGLRLNLDGISVERPSNSFSRAKWRWTDRRKIPVPRLELNRPVTTLLT